MFVVCWWTSYAVCHQFEGDQNQLYQSEFESAQGYSDTSQVLKDACSGETNVYD